MPALEAVPMRAYTADYTLGKRNLQSPIQCVGDVEMSPTIGEHRGRPRTGALRDPKTGGPQWPRSELWPDLPLLQREKQMFSLPKS